MALVLTEGMDPALVTQHRKVIAGTADTIGGLSSRLTAQITNLPWKGADREKFVSSSRSQVDKQLIRVAAVLTDRAKRLDTEIAKQIDTSTS